ncbi:YidH family protein [Pseudahrensia aquimaris]|uniref:YidH family protein n=1 Tax=Pseudahrensia aquimaris TaxID=744461 RepID=A0ABW3FE88_9HYPH
MANEERGSDEDKSSQELAEDRTDWAEDRTVLANERTFAGWMRTGMASLGIAIAMQAIFGEVEPRWFAKAGATVFILVGLLIFYAGWKNAKAMVARLDAHTAEPVSRSHLSVVAGMMALGSIIAGIVLWMI